VSRIIFGALTSLIAPVILLLSGINSKSEAYTRWVITLFFGIYGSTIRLYYASDGYRHREDVYEHYIGMSFAQFLDECVKIISFQITQSGTTDLYKHVLSFFLGSVLGIPELFFTVVALVYGYFFSGALIIILKDFQKARKTLLFIGFFLVFFLTKNIEGVNTVRTWTALWVMMYAFLKYQISGGKKYILLLFTPPLIHFSYFIMIVPLIIFLVLGNRPYIYAIIFSASSLFSIANPPKAYENLAFTEFVEQKQAAYRIDEKQKVEEIIKNDTESGKRFWKTYYNARFHVWAVTLLIIIILISKVYPLNQSIIERDLFSVGLLMFSFSNFVWFNPALSKRSAIIAILFTSTSYIMSLQRPSFVSIFDKNDLLRFTMYLALIALIPHILYNASTLIDFPSLYSIIFPFVTWIDPSLNLSLKELLRPLFPF
jgi:hypothetical protein